MEELFSKPWLERTNVLYYLSCGCSKKRKEKSYQPLPVPVDQDNPPTLADSSSLSDEIPLVDQQPWEEDREPWEEDHSHITQTTEII